MCDKKIARKFKRKVYKRAECSSWSVHGEWPQLVAVKHLNYHPLPGTVQDSLTWMMSDKYRPGHHKWIKLAACRSEQPNYYRTLCCKNDNFVKVSYKMHTTRVQMRKMVLYADQGNRNDDKKSIWILQIDTHRLQWCIIHNFAHRKSSRTQAILSDHVVFLRLWTILPLSRCRPILRFAFDYEIWIISW
jgi:hypothetical protein